LKSLLGKMQGVYFVYTAREDRHMPNVFFVSKTGYYHNRMNNNYAK